jgi:hypothetical protein
MSEIHVGGVAVLQGSGRISPTLARRPLSPRRPSSPHVGSLNRPSQLPLPYIAYVCFKCFRRFRCMLHLFHIDVAKVNQGMLHMLQLFQRHVTSVCFECFRCFRGMFHLCFPDACCKCVYLDVAYILNVCCMCFIWMLRMVAMVFKCFRNMFEVFQLPSDICCNCCI